MMQLFAGIMLMAISVALFAVVHYMDKPAR
jgi:hypothetical protein